MTTEDDLHNFFDIVWWCLWITLLLAWLITVIPRHPTGTAPPSKKIYRHIYEHYWYLNTGTMRT